MFQFTLLDTGECSFTIDYNVNKQLALLVCLMSSISEHITPLEHIELISTSFKLPTTRAI